MKRLWQNPILAFAVGLAKIVNKRETPAWGYLEEV
jgi:hypothetical protein